MNDFTNVTKRDPQVQTRTKDILVEYIKLSLNYH